MDIQILCNTDDDTLFAHIEANSRIYPHWLGMSEAHDGHAVIVGGGPSLPDHLESIRKRHELGQKIFALNGAAKFLNIHGIKPDYQVILDARADNTNLVHDAKQHLIASQVHPHVLAMIDKPVLWHPAIEDIEKHLPEHDADYALIGGGTTVGLSAMCLAYTMGYRKLHLYGYDSSHRGPMGHAYKQPQNAGDIMCKVTVGGKIFNSSLTMARQAELFPEVCNNLIDLGCIITVDSDGLIMAVMDEMRRASQPMSEEEKYQRMWDIDAYRTISPGENFAPEMVKLVNPKPSQTVVDFGCGTGRGGLKVQELTDCNLIQVDFADNCLDRKANATFVKADLTSPMNVRGDIGYCTDVMEHIPPELVDQTIGNIMACVGKCYFKIAMFDDNMGKLIGHPLHLSVFPFDYWKERFSGYDVLHSHEDKDTAFPYATFLVQARERA